MICMYSMCGPTELSLSHARAHALAIDLRTPPRETGGAQRARKTGRLGQLPRRLVAWLLGWSRSISMGFGWLVVLRVRVS